MNTKRFLIVAGVSVALVIALGTGVLMGGIVTQTVFAQSPTPGQPGLGRGFGPGMMGGAWAAGQTYTGTVGFGPGMMGGGAGFGYYDVMLPSLAKALGLSVDQLQAELKAGKTVQDIAKAKGISTEKLQADFLAAHKEALQKLVKDGKLTQQQADAMIDRMDDVTNHPCITGNVTPGQGYGPGRGGMGGMMGGGFAGRGSLGRSN